MDIVSRIASRFSGKTARIGLGQTVEVGSVRIHRFRPSIKVWDLTNAGKRGKKVRVLGIVVGHAMAFDNEEEAIGRLAGLIEMQQDYDSILGTIKDYLKDYPKDFTMHESEERGVDVMPAGFKPIEINGDKVEVKVTLREFTVTNLEDQANLPKCVPTINGGLKEIPSFYRWVQDNTSKVRSMSYQEVQKAMKTLGLDYHEYCSID